MPFDSSEKALQAIYNFKFTQANVLINESLTNGDSTSFNLLKTNFYWWMIISGEDNPSTRKSYIHSVNQSLKILDKKNKAELSNKDIEQYIQSYALKVRIELLNHNFMSGFIHLNNCVSYLKKSFLKEPEYEMFNLTSGLYNYFVTRSQKDHPFLVPYLIFYPKGNMETGIMQLMTAYKTKNPILKTEAGYFLMKIYLEQEKDYKKAEFFARDLLNKYPDNLIFRYYFFKSLLIQNKIDHAIDESIKINSLANKNSELTSVQRSHFDDLTKNDLENYYLKNPIK